MIQYVNEISEHKFRNKRLSLLVRFYERDYAYIVMQWHGYESWNDYGLAWDVFDQYYDAVRVDVVAGRWLLRLMRSQVENFDMHLAEWKVCWRDERYNSLKDLYLGYVQDSRKYIYRNRFTIGFNDEKASRIKQYWPQINEDDIPYYHTYNGGYVIVKNVISPADFDKCWPKEELLKINNRNIYEPSIDRLLQFVTEMSPGDGEMMSKHITEMVQTNEHIVIKLHFHIFDSFNISIQLISFPVRHAKQPNHKDNVINNQIL
jgi:hypothetical protein